MKKKSFKIQEMKPYFSLDVKTICWVTATSKTIVFFLVFFFLTTNIEIRYMYFLKCKCGSVIYALFLSGKKIKSGIGTNVSTIRN